MDYLQYRCYCQKLKDIKRHSFKPCYKWITFNTKVDNAPTAIVDDVLNLVINGLPSIPRKCYEPSKDRNGVLNLVINGLPSIPPYK